MKYLVKDFQIEKINPWVILVSVHTICQGTQDKVFEQICTYTIFGNGSCSPGVIEKYLIHAEPVQFSFSLRPYNPSMGNISTVARLKITDY